MAGWVVWLVVGCLVAVGEMLTMGLYLAPFAAGALLASALSVAGLGTAVAVVGFVVGSLAFLLALRPIARRHRRGPAALRTGTAALVGRGGVVLERIANAEAVGCVRIDGEVWTARAYDEDRIYEIGEQVQVVEIRGATALVMERSRATASGRGQGLAPPGA